MILTLDTIKKTVTSLGYKWYTDRPNIVGIRSTLQVPDIFNDFLCVTYYQPTMPPNLSVIATQKWLNKHGFKGKDGKPLKEDGVNGNNTQHALAKYTQAKSGLKMNVYVITTEPGIYYQKKVLNPKGCAMIKPGQYENCYQLGTHIKSDHKALIQTGGKITVWRDNDRDGIAENLGMEDTGYFGCNIHGAQRIGKTAKIGAYSAGCQVFESWKEKEEFINICEQYRELTGNKFTYTLIEEKSLIE